MLRFLLLLGLSVGVGFLFAAADRARRPLARIVRALVLGTAALLAIGGLAVAATGVAGESWWVAIIGGGMVAVAIRLAWAMRRRRGPRIAADGEPAHVPLTRPLHDPRWQRFEAGLDWISRKQARQARAAIDGFLAERDSPSLTVEHRTLLLSCEKRVPELIDICLERCRNARPEERGRYVDETLDTLVQLGAEARRARREVREADDRRLQVLHRYFDGVAGGDGRQG